jgi:ATP-dependent RNA helicase DDX56/DBP9
MSATLSVDVKRLQKEALNRPALLKLEEGDDEEEDKDSRLRQLSLRAPSQDRFLICYVMMKLRLVHGKTIVFVNSVDQGFKLQLFLSAFFISSLVLNSELPENSRNYVLGEFDAGKCNLLIATDESHLIVEPPASDLVEQDADEQLDDEEDNQKKLPKKKGAKRSTAAALDVAEFGVARGFDFKAVANVINFDFPVSADA